MFKKGTGVIVPLFDVIVCLLMLHPLRIPHFPFLLLLLVRGDDDLLVYTIASLAQPAPTPALVPIKPLITHVYSQC